MSDPILIREDVASVARLTLNTPGSLNALSDAMLAALKTAFTSIAADAGIKAVVIAGAGKAFCAGHDLKEMQAGRAAQDKGAAYFADLFARCGEVMQMIPALPQPVIAEVQGIATAAGCQLVASCDMAVATKSTRFGVNGVNIGLFCSTPMVALSRNVPRKQAFEMLTTGEFIDATRALDLGLINRTCAPDALTTDTMALAQTVASKLAAAVKIGKSAFYEQLNMPLHAAYAYTGEVMAGNMMLEDTAEGVQAFLEKRDPDWS
ncbi:MAG: enoyl-CoA hydratase [Maritimibacter sp.]